MQCIKENSYGTFVLWHPTQSLTKNYYLSLVLLCGPTFPSFSIAILFSTTQSLECLQIRRHFQDRFTLFLIIVIKILFQVMNMGNYFMTFFSDNITTISECKCKIKALVHLPESVYHNLDKFSVHWWLKIFSHIFFWRYILPPYMQDNLFQHG